jgi:uncharacterized LabA/DUF88 family protein
MRSRCAVYVDAGYLIASAATRVTGTSLRSGVHVMYDHLVQAIIDQAEASSQLPLLRVNWYDSGSRAGGLPDPFQESIGLLPRVKLRLGRLSNSGEQKGVDLRIGLDLIMHARNQAVDVMYLVSGDDDLSEAVEEVQGHGIPVILMAAPDKEGRPHAVSRHLLREADGIETINPEAIDLFVVARTRPEPEPEPEAATVEEPARPTPAILAARRPTPRSAESAAQESPRPAASLVYSSASKQGAVDELPGQEPASQELIDEVCASVITTWLQRARPDEVESLGEARPLIPGDIDRALLTDLSARTGHYYIEEPDRYQLRERFWVKLDELRPATA